MQRLLFHTLIVLCSTLGARAQTGQASVTPAPDSSWASGAAKQIARVEYEFRQMGGEGETWSAPNRAHEFRSRISSAGLEVFPRAVSADGVGAEWKLELRTTSFGRVGDERELSDVALSARGERIEIDRGVLVEWFENTSAGLEQGWTIPAPPEGDAPLWIGLDFHGLALRIDEGAKSGVLVDANGALRLRYSKLVAFDAAGRELCARLAPSANGVGVQVDDTGTGYPVVVDPLLTLATWSATGGQAGAAFGSSVACAGDVNGDGFSDAIVGAPEFDNGQTDEGRAFVFLGSAAGLGLTPAWSTESNQASASFAESVSTAGDVNGDGYDDVIIGARTFDSGETNEGAAFVYLGGPGGLAATPAWFGESNQADAAFGCSVSTGGDVNGDSYDDVIVGGRTYDNGESNEGRAWVYLGGPAGLASSPVWTAEGDQDDARFGQAVASAGDVNGDGYGDVIVGALLYDNGQSDEGRAVVYLGSASGLSASAVWTAEPDQNGASFGVSVASAGDVNGDGYSDVIVGAYLHDNGLTDMGRAYVFLGSVSGPSTLYSWLAEPSQANEYFGYSVSSAGDVNGDGFSDVLVGAYSWNLGGENRGRAYAYLGSASGLASSPAWSDGGVQADMEFGFSAAAAGDVNGDGFGDVIVGARLFDLPHTDEGYAIVYFGSASGLSSTSAWSAEGNQPDAQFGLSVASAGDVNGDGFGDVIVGAPAFDNGEANEGAAFVYLGSAIGLTTSAAWMAESDQVFANLGISVASAGDVNGDGYGDVIVGAYAYDNFQTDEGRVYLYLGSASGLGTAAAWQAESDQGSAVLGISVASAGDVNADGFGDVVIGAYQYDNGQSDEGVAFVYQGSAAGLAATPSALLEVDQPGVYFGGSVACAGDVNGDGFSDLVVGASNYSGAFFGEGRAFLYLGSAHGVSSAAAWTAAGGQAGANFGRSVASAGDVNGDGFSDVIVGAYLLDNGQTDEGRAYVYFGAVTGLSASASWTAESDLVVAQFGNSVATAGDVNGDGFSDVIVGAYNFNSGTNGGAAFVYLGSSSGLESGVAWSAAANHPLARFGYSVAAAGDVNGDGFGDVIVGAYQYDNGQSNEGAAFVFVGNEGLGSAVLMPQQRRASNSGPIASLGRGDTYDSFRLQLKLAKFPAPATGSDLAFLEWEVKPLGAAFDGTGLGRSVVGTPIIAGSLLTLNELVTGLTAPLPYHWRARIATDNPFYPHTPWVSLNGSAPIESKFRTLGGVVCPPSVNYCTSSLTTSGCTPVMSSTGTPSAGAPNGFSLHANSLEGAKSGLFFYGLAGPHSSTWGTGFLCVKAPTQRTPSNGTGGANGTCGGALSIDWRAYMSTHPLAIGHPLLEGKTFWAQCWFRDPPAQKTTNLSDGLRFTICL